jgi:acyl-CoA thioesterase YciA
MTDATTGRGTGSGNEPTGDLTIRQLAMPADTNANGDIFGGWLLGQMDLGGGIFASKIAQSRTVTVAIDAMNFRKAVFVGDVVSVHATLVRIGKNLDYRASGGLGAAPQREPFDPGDRRPLHLCLDR